ncbi:MAG: inverse autotransporter beta domain-containing protein [Rhodospirillales bacterium]|nr:inverse autotransporter beta domain-containing protein [Rhodospirillales bacterium]
MTLVRFTLGACLLGFLIAPPLRAQESAPATNSQGAAIFSLASQTAQSGSISAAAATLTNEAARYLLPGLGSDMPDWAKRIEFDAGVDQHAKPSYSILTVQPLFQSENKQDTLFIQGSQLRYDLFGEYRDTTNLGLGYRRLFFDNSLMIGANSFYDYEWTNRHQRYSIGGEVKYAMLDLYSNRYLAVTDIKDVGDNNKERVLEGYDIELRSQLPFMPWGRIGAKRYVWETKNSTNIQGWTVSADADIAQNLVLEGGISDDNVNDRDAFAKLTFRLAMTDRPVLLSSDFFETTPFRMRDMRSYTLDKVRRQNKILVEREARGVVIARGN